MINKLIFFPDYDSTTGFGHLNRLYAFAQQIDDLVEIQFIFQKVVPEKFPYNHLTINKKFNVENEFNWLKNNIDEDTSVLVMDGYRFDGNYFKKLKKKLKKIKLIYIDDYAGSHEFPDIIINHAPGVTFRQYKVQPATKLLLGLDYLMLRREFFDRSKKSKKVEDGSIFICLGGLDDKNLTEKITSILIHLKEVKKINVVLGHDYFHSLKRLENNKLKLYYRLSAQEIKNKMEVSKLIIVPSSTIALEALTLKKNMISIKTSQNQDLIHVGLSKFENIKCIDAIQGLDIKKFQNMVIDQIIKPNIIKNHKFNSRLRDTVLDYLQTV